MAKFIFTVELIGEGPTQRDAWLNAVDAFTKDCGQPASVMDSVEDVKVRLDATSTGKALWWFIENVPSDDPRSTELFHYLRERVRTTKKL